MKLLKTILVGLVLAIALSACESAVFEWKEEARQRDGTIVQVKRRMKVASVYNDRTQTGPIVWQELYYPPLNLTWKPDHKASQFGFSLIKGTPWISYIDKTTGTFCASVTPYTPTVRFLKYENSQWKEVGYQEAPMDEIVRNLQSHPPTYIIRAPKGALLTNQTKIHSKHTDYSGFMSAREAISLLVLDCASSYLDGGKLNRAEHEARRQFDAKERAEIRKRASERLRTGVW